MRFLIVRGKKVVLFISLVLISFGIYFQPQQGNANGANFSIKAVLPENQKKLNVSYFDFELLPNEEQTIEIEINNSTLKEQEYAVEANTATTNMNGVISYTKEAEEDENLPISFSKIAKVDERVVVPGNTTIRVPIQISMPEVHFEGIMLGGVKVSEVVVEERTKQITNHFSYSIAIVISQGEMMPVAELDLLGVQLEQINRRNVISATIQNKASTIVNDMTVEAQIYRKGQENPLFYRIDSGLRMAPNSSFNFGVGTDNQPLRAGYYTMIVKTIAGEQEWKWSKDFEITAAQAGKLNETAVELVSDNLKAYLLVAIVVATIFFVVVIYLLVRNKLRKGVG